MSTKTSIKRIAAVAAVALTFGGFSAVSAHAAAAITPTAVTVGTVPTLAPGVTSLIPVTIAAPTGSAATDTFTVTAKITSAPTGSAFASPAGAGTAAAGTGAGSSFITGVYAAGSTNLAQLTWTASTTTSDIGNGGLATAQKSDLTPAVSSVVTLTHWVTNTSKSVTLFVNFTPDKAGSYSILVSTGASAAASAAYAAGDANATITATTGSSATSVTFAAIGSSAKTGSSYGQLVAVKLNTGAQLANGEVLKVSSSTTTSTIKVVNQADGTVSGTSNTPVNLTNANFLNGVAYITVADSAATTLVLTAVGTGLLSSSVTTTASLTTKAVVAGTSVALANPTGATRPGSGHVGFSNNADTASISATSHTYQVTDTVTAVIGATEVLDVTLADTAGDITGIAGLTIDYGTITLTSAATTGYTGTVTVSGALAAAGDAFGVTVASGTQLVVTAATAAVKTATALPVNVIRGTVAGSTVLQAKVTDQFGAAVANTGVTVSVAGRNATTVSAALATGADGKVSYTVTDASTSTTNLVDTVTFTATGASNQSAGANVVTINYGQNAAAKVTITGGNTAASVANATQTINAIAAGDGAEAGIQPITATVKDANGALLSGVPVTFSVAGTGVAVPSASALVYTAADGTAKSYVYAWIAGTYTYTATAGTATTTGTITFADTTAAYARVLSASVNGSVVTAKVVDRFGNPVKGVTVYATKTGAGYIASSNTGVTAADGTIDFNTAGGSASVTVTTLDPAAVAGTNASGQTCALAGNLTCASGATAATAFTASVAGTTVTSESGVGASLAPAGVSSVTVAVVADTTSVDAAQAAQDAANEATDAANAATDAANNAMDSADAATAAAQDAGDKADAALAAITDLATKVSDIATQVSALSALVSKIAAAVAKISAKVKA